MRKYLLLAIGFLLLSSANGQSDPPKLGFALSGGGAKGLAHIGVLKVLEENGIYPDLLTGVSMGSIVGGLYSIGYTLEELEAFALSSNWNEYFSDTYPRAFLPVEEKNRADRYILTLALENGKLKIPRGLIQGKKIQTLLSGLTVPAHAIKDFDHFCLPFRCVATDLETGDAVVFSSGSLKKAIRSSMSIPSAFEPVEYDGRLLVDGYVVRNLPVYDAFDLGAELVLAVDVGSLLYKRDEINSVLTVLDQTSSFAYAASTQEQRDSADFLITPDLEGFSSLSYDAIETLIARGEEAARAAMPKLLAFLDSVGIERPMQKFACRQTQRDSFQVTAVKFVGDEPNTRLTLGQLFKADTPRMFTIDQLDEEIGRLYASGFFKSVDYDLIPIAGGYQLVFEAAAAPLWYVRGSINYDSDFNAGLLLNATGRNVGIRGSILSADLRVSENPGFFVDYLFYNRSSPSIGLKWHGSFNTFLGRRFDNFQLVDEFSFHHLSTRLSLVSGISRTAALEAGIFVDRLAQDRKFFTQQNEAAFAKQVGLFFKLSRDTYDRTYFPTEGSLTSFRAQWTFGGRLDERLDARENIPMDNNLVLTARLHKVFPLNENWWLSWINGAGLINYKQRSFINQLFLGREVPGEESFFEIMGLRYMEQPTTAFGSTAFRLRRRISKSSTFAGFTYNALWHASSEFQFLSKSDLRGAYSSDWFHGLGLELGALTTFGPIRLTSEYNLNIGRFNFSLFAGYRF